MSNLPNNPPAPKVAPADPTGGNSNPSGPLPPAPDVSESGHPTWCRQETCTPIEHRGRLIEIRTQAGEHAPVRLQLRQSRLPAALPVIVIAGDAAAVVMSLRQARAMTHSTRGMVRVAERAAA